MLHFFKHGAAQKAKPAASILETYPDKLPDELFERASGTILRRAKRSGYSNYSDPGFYPACIPQKQGGDVLPLAAAHSAVVHVHLSRFCPVSATLT